MLSTAMTDALSLVRGMLNNVIGSVVTELLRQKNTYVFYLLLR